MRHTLHIIPTGTSAITGDEEPVLTYRDPSEDTDLPKKKVRKKKANTDNGESA